MIHRGIHQLHFLLIFAFVSIISYQNVHAEPNDQVKNVILFIGDGMGISQISAVRTYLYGAHGRLNMEKFPVTGLVATHSIDELITDSAAGATAIATGYKTQNGMIAMLPDSSRLVSIFQAVKERGMSTGLIATSSITHATPACFAAQVMSRVEHTTIARQLVESKTDVILGGGKGYFLPAESEESYRDDQLDLLNLARESGYSLAENVQDMLSARGKRLLGLFARKDMRGAPDEPSLSEMTSKALEILGRNRQGFFLMVEGSKIDWAGHDNDFLYLIHELRAFDQAIGLGVEFARRSANTLVLVTADHETGGLNITGGHVGGKDIEVEWRGRDHTGQMVPLFAFGPKAQAFSRVMDNTDIARILGKILRLDHFPRKIEKTAVLP